MDIKFKLNLNMKNPASNSIKKFSKIITKKNINLESDIQFLLENQIITSYFEPLIIKHCNSIGINADDLIIDSYSVESKTSDVAIFFNTEDIERYSLKPSIYARSNTDKSEVRLFCEQIDNTSIRWYWNESEKETVFLDRNNHILKKIIGGINYYIESDLTPNKTYSRKIIINGVESLICSLTLKENIKTSVYDYFTVEDRDETIFTADDIYSSRLKAFSSGVGDSLSCKLFKQIDTDYGKKFRLLNRIYGIRASNVVKHHTTKFKYRYKMIGTIDYPSYDGSVKVNVTATPIDKNGNPNGAAIPCERTLEYSFDTNSQVADIYIEDLIPSLIKNYSVQYKISVTLTDVKGELTIHSHENGYRKSVFNGSQIVKFTEKGYYNSKFSISSAMMTKSKDFIEYHPPKTYEPLVGIVNGDFEVTESGKKDMISSAYMFAPPESVYNKKYYCEIEEVKPDSSYVKYKFFSELDTKDHTLVNGDTIYFSSDAIVENDIEYKDFLAQVEVGEYYIDDSRKHIYNYKLQDLAVNPDRYKRFELSVVGSSSDINILEHNKILDVDEDNKINTDVKVVVRAVQNAIAKWEPLIHNGYYYYNQEERFLYTSCMMDGHDKILDNVFTEYPIAIKVLVVASDTPGPIEIYDIPKAKKSELWTNRTLYFWYKNRIWPRPIAVSGKYYDFLEEYVYESEPFLFTKRPTSIKSITWDQVCTLNNSIDVYAISYNEVYGEWDEPVKLTHNAPLPENIKLSKIIKLRYILKPSRIPNLVVSTQLFSCENNWESFVDKYLSNNIYYKKEHLKPKSYKSVGNYISTIYDLGDTALTEKQRSIMLNLSHAGEVNIYVQHSDLKSDLENKMDNSTWIEATNKVATTNLKRYCRFKIEMKNKSKIYHMNLTLTRYEYDDNYDNFMPSFGNLRVQAEYNPILSKNIYEQVTAQSLEFDNKEHIIIPSLYEFVEGMAKSQKFEVANVLEYSISCYGELKDDFVIRYNQNSLTNESVYIQSKYIKYDLELMIKNQNGVVFDITDDRLEVSPIPQQYSPIVIIEENVGNINITSNDTEPMTNTFFVDENGELSLFNEEKFESLGFKTLYLSYTDIDEASVVIEINGTPTTEYGITNNIIEFKNKIARGYTVTVRYKIRNSYCVNYDYENDKAIIEFNKEMGASVEKVRIFYETNKETAIKKIDDINLNPIYNLAYSGYIYICDYSLDPHSVAIYPASNSIYANGRDDMVVMVVVRDKNNNPVENVDVNIACAYGTIIKKNPTTDTNGIMPCIYTSAAINCIDTIKVTASQNVKAKATIVNRKL